MKEFGETIFLSDKSVLYCKICDIKVNAEKIFTVIQHIKTVKHIQNINLQQLKLIKNQQLVSTSFTKKKKTYAKRCCQPMYLFIN